MQENEELQYVGFWLRVWASIIDSILVMFITMPILIGYYGVQYLESERFVEGQMDFFISWVLPAAVIIAFWVYKSATPGKMAVSAKIVDADSGEQPSFWQFVGRYLAYFISLLPLFLGFIWVAFDARKQGWHDKLAGTVVIRKKLKAGHGNGCSAG